MVGKTCSKTHSTQSDKVQWRSRQVPPAWTDEGDERKDGTNTDFGVDVGESRSEREKCHGASLPQNVMAVGVWARTRVLHLVRRHSGLLQSLWNVAVLAENLAAGLFDRDWLADDHRAFLDQRVVGVCVSDDVRSRLG